MNQQIVEKIEGKCCVSGHSDYQDKAEERRVNPSEMMRWDNPR